jgi:peptide/nickel transport system substrate-binding protein
VKRGTIALRAAMGVALVSLVAVSNSANASPASRPNGAMSHASRLALSRNPAGTRVQGGTLTIGTTEEPDTLNPDLTQLVTSNNVLSGIMEGMTDHDSKQHVIYRLATSVNVAKNGLTYTWHLRHGVTFQNGAPFSAADVLANYHMIMNPKFGSFSTDGWNDISKISTPDKYTVVMHLKKVFAPFLVDVGGTFEAPKGELAKGVKYFQQTFGRHPIGTGPFSMVKWESGQFIQLKANPKYWGHKPAISTIMYKIIPNDNTQMVQLKTGDIQMTDTLAPDKYKQIASMPNVVPVVRPSLSWYHLDIKNYGFLADTKVRLALAYATPVQEIIDRLLNGFGQPAPTDTPPASSYYDPHVKPYPYNPAKAAQLLKSDGFTAGSDGVLQKNGKKLSIQYWIPSGEQLTQEVMQVVSQSWRKIGIQVTDHLQDIKTIWGPNGYQFNHALTVGGYSWFNGNDPDDRFYFNSVDIPKTPTGSGGDAPEYFAKYPWQAKIDKLTNEGVATVDPAKRKKIYWKIQELLHQQEPLLFMYSVKLIWAAPKQLAGFNPSAFNSGMLWNVQDWSLTK